MAYPYWVDNGYSANTSNNKIRSHLKFSFSWYFLWSEIYLDSELMTWQMNLYKKLLKCQHPSEGKREEICSEDSDFFRHYNLSEQTLEAKIPSGNQVHRVISSSNSTLHKHDGKSNLFTNMQMHNYITAGCHRHVGQISDYPTLSSIDCENNSQLFPSPKESSYASKSSAVPSW